ncbi:MAG: polysaccharide biosynthesis protein [Firmicutes bacterium]|nr:polysaccharide biosynthesis protein [Bacillota bacterium]
MAIEVNGKLNTLRRRSALALADLVFFNMGVLLGLAARFEGSVPLQYIRQYVGPLGLVQSALVAVSYAASRLYSSIIRYSSIDEALSLAKGVTVSVVTFIGLITFFPPARGFPRSVPFVAASASFLLSGGIRILARMYLSDTWPWVRANRSCAVRRVILVGAGDAGAMVVRELKGRLKNEYDLVGLVDDDGRKQGMRLNGVPVLGEISQIPDLLRRYAVEEVIVAIPSASGSVIRRVFALCEGAGVKMKTVPGLYEIINGNVKVGEIRDVDVEDLLGREPVNLNMQQISGYIQGKCVLVTGAGGSIGSEICRQIAKFRPAKIVLFDHDENSIFELSHEVGFRFPAVNLAIVVGDVRDIHKVHATFEEYKPGVVFHAAAHKHVPLMEEHPEQAVKTNVFGTLNVALAAWRGRTDRFVLISTDKAVNPTSVMGATKAVAEHIVVTLDKGWHPVEGLGNGERRTKFMAVRFGNVLGSRGSVIPLFKEQIARGGPVTVTHPEMKRYFMTIPEAVQLVIQSGALGDGREVFVLDMGDPVRIVDLAETLIRLSGLEPGKDITVEFSGMRNGEKLFEEIFSDEEKFERTAHPKIFVAKDCVVDADKLRDSLSRLEKFSFDGGRGPKDTIKWILKELIPTYNPWSVDSSRASRPGEPRGPQAETPQSEPGKARRQRLARDPGMTA